MTNPVDPHDLVIEFHNTYRMPIGMHPDFLTVDRETLRVDLIEEEFTELVDALAAKDLNEAADALGDMVYVIYGMAIEMGIHLSPVLTEIQRSNMSKLGADGKPIYREDGKVLKGPNFSPPDIGSVLYGA